LASQHQEAQLVQVVLEVQELLVQLAQPRVLELELQALAVLKVPELELRVPEVQELLVQLAQPRVLELELQVLEALKVLQVVPVDWELIQQEALDRSALLVLLMPLPMARQARV
jgi:hypothetical protein